MKQRAQPRPDGLGRVEFFRRDASPVALGILEKRVALAADHRPLVGRPQRPGFQAVMFAICPD